MNPYLAAAREELRAEEAQKSAADKPAEKKAEKPAKPEQPEKES